MSRPTVLHFQDEYPTNKAESRINLDLQKEDADLLTYEGYDVSELI